MRSRSLLDAKQKIFTYNHTSNSLFWNCFSKYTSQSLYLISLAVGKFVGYFSKNMNPPTYVKAAFREKVHPLKQKFKICLQPHLSLSSRGKSLN